MSFFEQFSTIFIRLIAIFLMLAAGIYARRKAYLDAESTRRLSVILTSLLYPSAIFFSLVSKFSLAGIFAQWVMPLGAFLIIVGGFFIGLLVSFLSRGEKPELRRAFHFQCAVNNYIFMPLPLVVIFWPDTGLANLALSTIGSEIGVWTLGIMALTGFSFKTESLKKLLSAPMMAIIISFGVISCKEFFPALTQTEGIWLESWQAFLSAAEMLGAATVPLAMIIAGSRMAVLKSDKIFTALQFWLLLLRMIIIPAVTVPLLIFLLPLQPETRFILVLIAIMPCSVSSVTLSEIYQADSDFAASSVLVTTIACLITVPLWLAIAA